MFTRACRAVALAEAGPLATALAALMRRRNEPAELELLTSGLDEGQQALLVDVIKAYFPVPENEKGRYERLLSRKEYRVVQDVELTWSERLRQEGLEKGREAGFVEGKREVLKRQLVIRFGPLPADVEARIDTVTSADELDRYLERILTAGSLAEMGFG